jgi:predicted phage terminase large subunit-like protein
VNNWYDNTVASRLFNPLTDSIIIIMQRTHENDLCWHLIDKMNEWHGEDWEVISLPAIAEEREVFDTDYWIIKRDEWVVLDLNRYPTEALMTLKNSLWKTNFNCQYQQNPTSKENQEFHEEWFNYYDIIPTGGRTFTTVDPAFSKKLSADDSAITTGKFIWDKLYILEQTAGKFDPAELEDKILYHTKKWRPEKVGIEAVAAQTTIWFSLRNRFKKEWIYINVDDIRQNGDKEAKIRSLIPLYRNWQIFHHQELQKLESQLMKFPRGKHDDCPDSLQMLYYMYELMPHTSKMFKMPKIVFDKYWQPKVI